MEKQITLSHWIQNFNQGEFDKKDTQTQIKAGGKVDLETCYVWFKNNCPLNGPLYDDFRIADIETNNNLIVVQIDCIWNDFKYTAYERLDGFEKPVFESNSSRELVKWLNQGWIK